MSDAKLCLCRMIGRDHECMDFSVLANAKELKTKGWGPCLRNARGRHFWPCFQMIPRYPHPLSPPGLHVTLLSIPLNLLAI